MKNIKIPPGYKNVKIYKNNDKILAHGFDSKNRKQVIYNPIYINNQNNLKYKKILKLNKIFNKIKLDNYNIINKISISDNKTYDISIIIFLILNCGFRIGNLKYKCENNSYGITTLEYKHLIFKNNNIIIDFIGKKGIRNISKCNNIFIYKYLYNKFKKNKNKNNKIFDYTSIDVNNFLKNYHNNITSKDLRTWNANNMLLKFIKLNEIKNTKNPVKNAIIKVADNLHNSYHICLKSYINPIILEKLKNKFYKH